MVYSYTRKICYGYKENNGLVRSSARRLFALLICIDLPHRIPSFVDAGLNDLDLPFIGDSANNIIRTSLGSRKLQTCFSEWRQEEIERLLRTQWAFLAVEIKINRMGDIVPH
jgi:hypothetical protein